MSRTRRDTVLKQVKLSRTLSKRMDLCARRLGLSEGDYLRFTIMESTQRILVVNLLRSILSSPCRRTGASPGQHSR
jgi:hypothetical protein